MRLTVKSRMPQVDHFCHLHEPDLAREAPGWYTATLSDFVRHRSLVRQVSVDPSALAAGGDNKAPKNGTPTLAPPLLEDVSLEPPIQGECRLFLLPTELRLQIYAHVMQPKHHHHSRRLTSPPVQRFDTVALQISRETRTEAAPTFLDLLDKTWEPMTVWQALVLRESFPEVIRSLRITMDVERYVPGERRRGEGKVQALLRLFGKAGQCPKLLHIEIDFLCGHCQRKFAVQLTGQEEMREVERDGCTAEETPSFRKTDVLEAWFSTVHYHGSSGNSIMGKTSFLQTDLFINRGRHLKITLKVHEQNMDQTIDSIASLIRPCKALRSVSILFNAARFSRKTRHPGVQGEIKVWLAFRNQLRAAVEAALANSTNCAKPFIMASFGLWALEK